jgi:hypothetical protein
MSNKTMILLFGLILGIISLALTSCPTPPTSQQVAAPTFNPPEGTYASAQLVNISSTTAGAAIRYTTDGSMPTSTNGTIYVTAISVLASETIRAIAFKSGWTDSFVATAAYMITGTVAAPTFDPPGGTFSNDQSVIITCATSGASIYYTTDNSTPSGSSPLYTTAISVSGNGTTTTIKAYAVKAGMGDSAVSVAGYKIDPFVSIGTVFYYDYFNRSDTSSTWSTNAYGLFSTNNGEYEITCTSTQYVAKSKPINLPKTQDFRIQVKTKWLSGISNNGYGIIFRDQETGNNQYRFLISNAGSFTLLVGTTPIVDWTYSNKILIGSYNTIKCECVESSIKCYINDTLVTNASNSAFTSGYCYLTVSDQQTVRFDDFKIWYLLRVDIGNQ